MSATMSKYCGHSGKRTDAQHAIDNKRAGKALAVWLYQIGVKSLDETAAAFARNPSWRAA